MSFSNKCKEQQRLNFLFSKSEEFQNKKIAIFVSTRKHIRSESRHNNAQLWKKKKFAKKILTECIHSLGHCCFVRTWNVRIELQWEHLLCAFDNVFFRNFHHLYFTVLFLNVNCYIFHMFWFLYKRSFSLKFVSVTLTRTLNFSKNLFIIFLLCKLKFD